MSLFSSLLVRKAELVLQGAIARGWMVTTAESCTGGLVSGILTGVAGSSSAFAYGFVTYANEAKQAMVGVSAQELDNQGAVSKPVAIAMAEGALRTAKADISVAITGIAGPGGATHGKPVGLVHFASARRGFSTLHEARHFSGDRELVRLQAVDAALELLLQQFAR